MSIDFNIFYNSRNQFSAEAFGEYAAQFGVKLEFHPDCDILTRKGIVPAKLTTALFSSDGEEKAYITAFESYPNDYEHPEIDQPKPEPYKKKQSFFARLFNRKKYKTVEAEKEPALSPFDLARKDCDKNIFLSCCGQDAIEVLAAFIYGAYYCRSCGAVFDNPQLGRFYTDPDELEGDLAQLLDEFKTAASENRLPVTEFTEWGELPPEKPVIRN